MDDPALHCPGTDYLHSGGHPLVTDTARSDPLRQWGAAIPRPSLFHERRESVMQTRVARLHGRRHLEIETQSVPGPGPGEVLLQMAAGGICGSDLHYYQDGGFGPVRVREPIISGHEASGYVRALGSGISNLVIGQLVAVNPSQPCGHCLFARRTSQFTASKCGSWEVPCACHMNRACSGTGWLCRPNNAL